MSSTFRKVFAASRIAFGTFSLLAPNPLLGLCQMPLHSSAVMMTRMFGVRDAVLGGLLWTAESPAGVRRALIAGAVCDGIDVFSAAYSVFNGDLSMLAGELVGGGAILFLGLGLYGLRSPGLLKMSKA